MDTYLSPLNLVLGNAPAMYTSTETLLGQFSHGKLPKPWEYYLNVTHALLHPQLNVHAITFIPKSHWS